MYEIVPDRITLALWYKKRHPDQKVFTVNSTFLSTNVLRQSTIPSRGKNVASIDDKAELTKTYSRSVTKDIAFLNEVNFMARILSANVNHLLHDKGNI